jgi:hypothetical protein
LVFFSNWGAKALLECLKKKQHFERIKIATRILFEVTQYSCKYNTIFKEESWRRGQIQINNQNNYDEKHEKHQFFGQYVCYFPYLIINEDHDFL